MACYSIPSRTLCHQEAFQMKKLRHRGVRLLGGGHTAQMRGSLPEPRTAGLWKEMVGMGGGVQLAALGSDASSSLFHRLEEKGKLA